MIDWLIEVSKVEFVVVVQRDGKLSDN